jgi:hypothetical protein
MVEPVYGLDAFKCPHCTAYAQQKWMRISTKEHYDHFNNYSHDFYELVDFTSNEKYGLAFCDCTVCNKKTIWLDRKIVYPQRSNIEDPKSLMPLEVKKLYEEARAVFPISPRSSAALLRLALEELLPHLGADKKSNINAMIAQLVRDRKVIGRVKEAMDYVRVTGNDAVHPGILDKEGKDDAKVSLGLFKIINYIVAETLENDAMVDGVYKELPDHIIGWIEDRDKVKK